MDISTEIAAIEAASVGEELRQPLIDALGALNSGSLPAVTSSDAGKILKVNSDGEWVVGEKSGYMPVPSASLIITQNGTYNVLNNAEAIVSVSGSGSSIIYSATTPTSDVGNNGDVWVKYTHYVNSQAAITITVSGGYNGGATIAISKDGTTIFTATGDSPYNLAYDKTTDTVAGVTITVTPPVNSTSALSITIASQIDTVTKSVMYDGSNTSYGYNYSDSFNLTMSNTPYDVIDNFYLKYNGAWIEKGAQISI